MVILPHKTTTNIRNDRDRQRQNKYYQDFNIIKWIWTQKIKTRLIMITANTISNNDNIMMTPITITYGYGWVGWLQPLSTLANIPRPAFTTLHLQPDDYRHISLSFWGVSEGLHIYSLFLIGLNGGILGMALMMVMIFTINLFSSLLFGSSAPPPFPRICA